MAVEIPVHPSYHTNMERGKAGTIPCIVCGRGVDDAKGRYFVHVIGGGCMVATEKEIDEGRVRLQAMADMGNRDRSPDWIYQENADLGAYPIGPDCLRQHPELREYVYDLHAGRMFHEDATYAATLGGRE